MRLLRQVLQLRSAGVAREHRGSIESRSGVDALNPALARRLGIESGLATPLKAEGFDGYFIAAGISSMCWDDLIIARRVAEDIAGAFDRSAALRASAATAEAARTSIRSRIG